MQYLTFEYAIEHLGTHISYYTLWNAFGPHFIGSALLMDITATGVKAKIDWGSNINRSEWQLDLDGVTLTHSRQKYPIYSGLPDFSIYKVYSAKECFYVQAIETWEVEDLIIGTGIDYDCRIVYNHRHQILKPI